MNRLGSVRTADLFGLSVTHRGQRNDQTQIIGLHLRIVCGTVAANLPAFIAFLQDDIPFFRVGLCRNRTQNAAAGIGTVTGIDIHMERAQTLRTVIT